MVLAAHRIKNYREILTPEFGANKIGQNETRGTDTTESKMQQRQNQNAGPSSRPLTFTCHRLAYAVIKI